MFPHSAKVAAENRFRRVGKNTGATRTIRMTTAGKKGIRRLRNADPVGTTCVFRFRSENNATEHQIISRSPSHS